MCTCIYNIFLLTDSASRGERCCQRALSEAKAYAEGLQEGEVPREGGREGIAENAAARALSEAKAYAEGRWLAGGRSPEGGREGGDSRERCCQSPVRGEGLRRRPKACRRAKSRGREGIAGERE